MTIKRFESPFSCVIFPLTQPQVAKQQTNISQKQHLLAALMNTLFYIKRMLADISVGHGVGVLNSDF